jgi:hypothetical protein
MTGLVQSLQAVGSALRKEAEKDLEPPRVGVCLVPRSEGIVLQLGQLAWGVPHFELSFVDLSGFLKLKGRVSGHLGLKV